MSLFKKRKEKAKYEVIYIVMHSTLAWNKNSSSMYGRYVIKPEPVYLSRSYDKVVEWINSRRDDYIAYINGWATEEKDLPGSTDEKCFSRMWIVEQILEN